MWGELLQKSQDSINAELTTRVNDFKLINTSVDQTELLARFNSYKGSLSPKAKLVVDKAVEYFKLTNKFEKNTYEYVQNIIGEEDAKRVASELCKVGFFYPTGFVPRKSEGRNPEIGLEPKNLLEVYILDDGRLVFDGYTPDEFEDFTVIPIVGDGLKVIFDVAPYKYAVFAANQWALEQECFGGVYSMDASDNLKAADIFPDKSVQELFMELCTKGNQYVIPDVKLSKLLDLSTLEKLLNSSTAKLLEDFEVNLACFDENMEVTTVYLRASRTGLDIVRTAIEPMLAIKGVSVAIID